MLREIITVKSENYNLKIPKEYLDKKIEILVFNLEDEINNNNVLKNLDKTFGILKDRNIDPIKWQKDLRENSERY